MVYRMMSSLVIDRYAYYPLPRHMFINGICNRSVGGLRLYCFVWSVNKPNSVYIDMLLLFTGCVSVLDMYMSTCYMWLG